MASKSRLRNIQRFRKPKTVKVAGNAESIVGYTQRLPLYKSNNGYRDNIGNLYCADAHCAECRQHIPRHLLGGLA